MCGRGKVGRVLDTPPRDALRETIGKSVKPAMDLASAPSDGRTHKERHVASNGTNPARQQRSAAQQPKSHRQDDREYP